MIVFLPIGIKRVALFLVVEPNLFLILINLPLIINNTSGTLKIPHEHIQQLDMTLNDFSTVLAVFNYISIDSNGILLRFYLTLKEF